jgi:hypothetical protein
VAFSLCRPGFSTWVLCVNLWGTNWCCGKIFSKRFCCTHQLSFHHCPIMSVIRCWYNKGSLDFKRGRTLNQATLNGASIVCKSKTEDEENCMKKSFVICSMAGNEICSVTFSIYVYKKHQNILILMATSLCIKSPRFISEAIVIAIVHEC